jgi:hypothetical protein
MIFFCFQKLGQLIWPTFWPTSEAKAKATTNYWLGQFFELRWKTHHTSVLAKGMICKISDFGLTRDVYVDDTYWKKSNGRSKCVYYFNLGSIWKIMICFQIHTYYIHTISAFSFKVTTENIKQNLKIRQKISEMFMPFISVIHLCLTFLSHIFFSTGEVAIAWKSRRTSLHH